MKKAKVKIAVSIDRSTADALDAYALCVGQPRWKVVRTLVERGAQGLLDDSNVAALVEQRKQLRLSEEMHPGRPAKGGFRIVDGKNR